jgi:hypothetical protein
MKAGPDSAYDRRTPTRDDSRVLVYGIVQDVTGGHLLFGFAFRGGRGRSLRDLEEFDVAASDADFMWVRLDLRDVAAQAWLRGCPTKRWPLRSSAAGCSSRRT